MSDKLQLEIGKTYRANSGVQYKIVYLETETNQYLGVSATSHVVWFFNDGRAVHKYDGDAGDLTQEYKREVHGTVWINAYPQGYTSAWPNRDEADAFAGSDRIGCKKIEFTVEAGEGL